MIIETKTKVNLFVHFVEFLIFWAAIEFEIGMWSCVCCFSDMFDVFAVF